MRLLKLISTQSSCLIPVHSSSAVLIYQQLRDLTNELTRLETRVKKMDSHFSNAQNDLNDILITTKKISNKKDNLLKLEENK